MTLCIPKLIPVNNDACKNRTGVLDHKKQQVIGVTALIIPLLAKSSNINTNYDALGEGPPLTDDDDLHYHSYWILFN